MQRNLDMSQRASLQFGRKEQSEQIGPCKHLQSNTVHPYGEVTQLWIAMPKIHQVCEKLESMRGKKGVYFQLEIMKTHPPKVYWKNKTGD